MSLDWPVALAHAEVLHVCRLPFASPSPLLTRTACVPVVLAAANLTTKPYCVPAVSVGGVGNVAVIKPPEPLDVPGMVTVARSPPAVITILPPLAVLASTTIFGFVP